MGFFGRLKDATIGFSGYARLARTRWAFGFMTLILLLSVAVGVARWTLDAQAFGEIAAREMATGPDWGLVDHEFHYEGPMPAFPDNGIVVDTTGSYTPERLQQEMDRGILITKDRAYNWRSGSLQVLEFKDMPFNFTRADMSKLMQQLYVFTPLLGVFTFLFQLAFKALDAVILAWIGQAVLRRNPSARAVPFGMAYQIALYAMTLPIILQWIFPLSTWGWGFFLWWFVAIIYTVGGLRASLQGQNGLPE